MTKLFESLDMAGTQVPGNWVQTWHREFYDGDLDSSLEGPNETVFNKIINYPMSLTHLRSRATFSYRRTLHHVRTNKVGLRVIWFVKNGSVRINGTQGACVIRAGEAGFLNASRPFTAAIHGETDSLHESYQAIVPPYLFLSHLQEADRAGKAFSLETPEGAVTKHLLDTLLSHGNQIGRHAAKLLAKSLLETIADNLRANDFEMTHKLRLIDRRMQEIENYILMNLADPDLCYEKVALKCGISQRYLWYVLKENDTSFSDLLWKNRLPKARDFLVAPSTRGYSIQEIAYMSGFKSAAHFSRKFKTEYQMTPREYRAAHVEDA